MAWSAYGTKPTLPAGPHMSAFGGYADKPRRAAKRPGLTLSGLADLRCGPSHRHFKGEHARLSVDAFLYDVAPTLQSPEWTYAGMTET